MAQLEDMAGYEAAIARKLAKLLQAQLIDVMAELGNPPDYANIRPSVWERMEVEAGAVVLPEVEAVYLAAAEQTMNAQAIGVNWGLANEQAAAWADKHVGELIKNISDTTRSAVQKKVAAYYRDPSTLGDLKKSLQSIYGPIRAEMIAITEATRAAAEGQLEVVQQLRGQGVELEIIWQTANDDLTCPICEPLNQTKQGEEWTDAPPAHPRCRCWINGRFPTTGGTF